MKNDGVSALKYLNEPDFAFHKSCPYKLEFVMFAVIETGGKQYKVAQGQRIKLEKLPFEEGQTVVIDKVLMICNGDKVSLGKPFIENASIEGKVLKQGRGDKIRIVKFRRRKNSRRIAGHRQYFTEIEVTQISG